MEISDFVGTFLIENLKCNSKLGILFLLNRKEKLWYIPGYMFSFRRYFWKPVLWALILPNGRSTGALFQDKMVL